MDSKFLSELEHKRCVLCGARLKTGPACCIGCSQLKLSDYHAPSSPPVVPYDVPTFKCNRCNADVPISSDVGMLITCPHSKWAQLPAGSHEMINNTLERVQSSMPVTALCAGDSVPIGINLLHDVCILIYFSSDKQEVAAAIVYNAEKRTFYLLFSLINIFFQVHTLEYDTCVREGGEVSVVLPVAPEICSSSRVSTLNLLILRGVGHNILATLSPETHHIFVNTIFQHVDKPVTTSLCILLSQIVNRVVPASILARPETARVTPIGHNPVLYCGGITWPSGASQARAKTSRVLYPFGVLDQVGVICAICSRIHPTTSRLYKLCIAENVVDAIAQLDAAQVGLLMDMRATAATYAQGFTKLKTDTSTKTKQLYPAAAARESDNIVVPVLELVANYIAGMSSVIRFLLYAPVETEINVRSMSSYMNIRGCPLAVYMRPLTSVLSFHRLPQNSVIFVGFADPMASDTVSSDTPCPLPWKSTSIYSSALLLALVHGMLAVRHRSPASMGLEQKVSHVPHLIHAATSDDIIGYLAYSIPDISPSVESIYAQK